MMSRKDGAVEGHLESNVHIPVPPTATRICRIFGGHNLHLVGEFVKDIWNKRAREDIWGSKDLFPC